MWARQCSHKHDCGFFLNPKARHHWHVLPVSTQPLQRYVTEFDFRYNHRETKEQIDDKWIKGGYNDSERAAILLKNIGGKRLTYYWLMRGHALIAWPWVPSSDLEQYSKLLAKYHHQSSGTLRRRLDVLR